MLKREVVEGWYYMKYLRKGSENKKSGYTHFLVSALLFGIILIQANVTCGTSPRVDVPSARAATLVNCANPTPSDNSTPALQAPATPGIVLINEVLTSPASPWACTTNNNTIYNTINAWVEIYNPQDQPLDLYTAHTSIDQGAGTESSTVPSGSIIEAHGFLVVFPFTDASAVSQVRITISQTVIDQVSLPSLATDNSYARIPDGDNNWQITTTPTIASSNILDDTSSSNESSATRQTSRPTSTQNHTSRSRSTGTHNSATDTPNAGAQPTWSALRLPSPESNNAATNNNTSHDSSPSATASDPFDLPKKILFTVLIVVCSFALVWGWWRYRRK
jgi:hypothetical protein